jgi:hypothetical protein
MRAPATAAAIALALGTLPALAPRASAASDCQDAFERWALVSSAQVRKSSDSGRGACLPSEEVRQGLLDGLERTRQLCGDAASDQSQQQTRTMLIINQSFISSLSLCHGAGDVNASVDTGAGWVTKAAPAAPAAPPKVVASPLPAAPAAPPLTGGPRPAVIAPTPAAPKAATASPAPTPPCLEVARGQSDSFALVNRRCRGFTVLAVIETRNAAGQSSCRGYDVSQSLAVRSAAPPRVNYECVVSQSHCNKDRLGDMFPECDW